MIKIFFFLLLNYFSLVGYSIFFKNKILRNKNLEFINLDIFYGIFFVILIAIITNFFSPLIYYGILFVPFGLILLILFLKDYTFKINFLSFTLILFFFIFISFSNQLAGDTPFYHLQTIKWFSEFKISFGLANLEPRYGIDSIWHILLSIFNITIFDVNLIYHFNLIIYAIVFNELFNVKNNNIKKLSFGFLFLSLSFLLIYNFIHPMKNGTIFSNLGSPEVDTLAMLFFILSGFVFLKINEINEKDNYIQLLVIIVSLTYLTKLSYVMTILFLIFLLLDFKKLLKMKIIIFAFLVNILWVLRNLIISGCAIFPLKITCLDFSWTYNSNEIEIFSKIIRSFARDTPLRKKYMDFNYTIETNDWFIPWFNTYFLETSLLIICSFILLISITSLIIMYFLNKKIFLSKNFYFFLLICILSLFFWLQAPEIRFGYGYIISLTILFVSLLYMSFVQKITFINKNILNFIFILILLANVQKNSQNFQKINLDKSNNFNYDNFDLIYKENGYEIYRPPPSISCGFFPKICVYQEGEYSVNSNLSYLIFKKNK